MEIQNCSLPTGDIEKNGRERARHGSIAFPLACYDNDCAKDAIPWHWHDEAEVLFMVKGQALIHGTKGKLLLQEEEGCFINAETLHFIEKGEKEDCRFYSMVFHPRLVGGASDSIFYCHYLQRILQHKELDSLRFSPDIPWQKTALSHLRESWKLCADKKEAYEFYVRRHLSELFILLLQNCPKSPPDVRHKKAACQAERSKQMLQYIHEHYKEEISLSQIARSASLSKSECLRCFQSTIHSTPIRYLRAYRIQKACALLQEENLSIGEIALSCGFQDFSYFTKTFREVKGMTPGAYRIRGE